MLLQEEGEIVRVAKAKQFSFYIGRVPRDGSMGDNAPFQAWLANDSTNLSIEVVYNDPYNHTGNRFISERDACHWIYGKLLELGLLFDAAFNNEIPREWLTILVRIMPDDGPLYLLLRGNVSANLFNDAIQLFGVHFHQTGEYEDVPDRVILEFGFPGRNFYFIPVESRFHSDEGLST